MHSQIAIIAMILALMLWCVVSAAALKCNGLSEGILAGRDIRQKLCILEGRAWYVNIWGRAHWEGVYTVRECIQRLQIFFESSSELTNYKGLMAK